MHPHHVIEHDLIHNCWLCRLNGHSDPVIITDSLSRMEEFLDMLDMQAAEDEQVIHVHLQRKQSHGVSAHTEEGRVDTDRDGCCGHCGEDRWEPRFDLN